MGAGKVKNKVSKGMVYILTNDYIPGVIKIGYTTQPIENRLKELDKTGVPWPYKCYFAIKTNRYKEIEQYAHNTFADYRIRDNREFFKVSPEKAVAALRISGEQEIKFDDDAIDEFGKRVVSKHSQNFIKKRFNFEKYGIPVGAELSFTRDQNKKCVVVKGGNVSYNGTIYSLSKLALELMKELGYNWKYIQGPAFFSYDGTILTELKNKNEEE
ncbi:MAG: GIY-YIG nuclease family protein [Fibrobacter sp.]|uniref:GIY-YIG nuclease family protein n=1 Tax=Fibrobacter sp. TaxID=35828 RepID=UPI0025B7E757|nr:GIY-YIG nuclease family protein [Fibrobacter sp.]MBR4785247.1 GIY-YIG nuclease family protein [Fibrobacter sp.]